MAKVRDELKDAMKEHGETLADIVSSTMSESQMSSRVSDGYGLVCGPQFTVWTANRVYFPACYDGMEWVASVPRNPNGETTAHIGGG